MVCNYMKILSEGYDCLERLPAERAGLGALVLNGLRAIQDSPALMSSIIHGISPVTEHFFHELATLPQSDESHWMSLFEDMAILFREHALGNAASEISLEGTRLLECFETCGLWAPGDGTLVSQWYWEELPRRCATEESRA